MNTFAAISSHNLYHEANVNCFRLVGDSIFTGSDERLTKWSFKDCELLKELPTGKIRKLLLIDNTKQLLALEGNKLAVYSQDLAKVCETPEIEGGVNFIATIGNTEFVAYLNSKDEIVVLNCKTLAQESAAKVEELKAETEKIRFLSGSSANPQCFVGCGDKFVVLNFNNKVFEKNVVIKVDFPVIDAMDADDRTVIFIDEKKWYCFQKDCEAPYYESDPLTIKPAHIYGFNNNKFYIVGEDGEVQIWDSYHRHLSRKIPPIKNLIQFELYKLERVIIAYGGNENRVEVMEMVIEEQEKLLLDSDYFRGLLLNYKKEGWIDELIDDNFFRGYYKENMRHGPATVYYKNRKIKCNYVENWMVGPIEVIELDNNRLKIVGNADYFTDDYKEIDIHYLESNGIKIYSKNTETPITSGSYSGVGKLVFSNGLIIEGALESNKLKVQQNDANAQVIFPGEEPVSILEVDKENPNKLITSNGKELLINYDTGEVTTSEIDI